MAKMKMSHGIKARQVSLKVWLILLFAASILLSVGLVSLVVSAIDEYNDRFHPYVEVKEGDAPSPDDELTITWKGDPVGGFQQHRMRHVGANTVRYRVVNALSPVLSILLSALSMLALALLFYRLKLRKPLMELTEGMEHIRRQDLNFTVNYNSRDEMGELCRTFESMRMQLDSAFQQLWQAQESQRQLTQAFAHDLRTPLTVLKGYAGILGQQAVRGNLQPDKVQHSALLMQDNITRMEGYLDGMQDMHITGQWSLNRERVSLCDLADHARDSYLMLAKQPNKKITVTCRAKGDAELDVALVNRVLDNLTANALQHAASHVLVELLRENDDILLRVEDDGEGFSPESLRRGFEAFYRGDISRSGANMGLGLTIASSLALQHGGELSISNQMHGGRIAGAVAICRLPSGKTQK